LSSRPAHAKLARPSLKNKQTKRAGKVTPKVKCLPSQVKRLGSIPGNAQKTKFDYVRYFQDVEQLDLSEVVVGYEK
jgi:hypothetical protein